MDLGSGVAVGTLCVSIGAVWITAIRSKSNNGSSGKKHCDDHSGVCQFMESMDAMMAEMRQDIKTLIMRK
jgi:hypothetical protein